MITPKALQLEIIRVAEDIFTTMLMMKIDGSAVDKNTTATIQSNITSILGLGGDVRGTLYVHFPEKTATAITPSFLGMEVDSIDEDVKDAVGEIANMMAGGIKIFLSSHDIQTELAIPSTVIGNSYRTSRAANIERVLVPFSCSAGPFWVELKYVIN